jgi:DNA-binding PadR family transcriptional regulator
MARPRHSSKNITRILRYMLENPAVWQHGYEISLQLDIPSGSLYPALVRLNGDGLLQARWELPEVGGRPRHLYRLTSRGVALARSLTTSTATPLSGTLRPNAVTR